QRNAALRRVAGGFSSREAFAPWTEQVASLGRQLVETRAEVVAWLASGFAERSDELGLPAARIAYDGEPPRVEALEARLVRSLERHGPAAGGLARGCRRGDRAECVAGPTRSRRHAACAREGLDLGLRAYEPRPGDPGALRRTGSAAGGIRTWTPAGRDRSG